MTHLKEMVIRVQWQKNNVNFFSICNYIFNILVPMNVIMSKVDYHPVVSDGARVAICEGHFIILSTCFYPRPCLLKQSSL